MLSRRLLIKGAILGFCSVAFAQQTPAPSPQPRLHEFPLTLQQSFESGKSKIGTKVQAKLLAATMLHGTTIPKDAVFSGVVIESTAKGGKDPARLAIRMDTVEWKGGSTSITAYLLPVYYEAQAQPVQSPPIEAPDVSSRTMNDAGQDAGSPMNRPFPTNDTQAAQAAIPQVPTTSHPVRMKNVTLATADEGGAALVSEHFNIKVHKLTTYIFASVEPAAN